MKTRRAASAGRQASAAISSPAAVVSRAPRREAGAAPRECAVSWTRQGRAQAGISCARPVVKSARKADAPRIHCGIDFLKVSTWLEWPDEDRPFLDSLERRKKLLQEEDGPDFIPISAGGMDWNLARTGASKFPYRLIVGDIALLLSKRDSSGDMPSARLEFGSLTSQTDLLASLVKTRHFLKSVGAKIVREHVSEIHLATDFVGSDIRTLELFDMDRWITKSRYFANYYEHRQFTGCQFGKGNFVLRCYDKVLSLKSEQHKQPIFANLWGVEKYDDLPVTRVEFQLRRPVLRDFKNVSLEEEGCALGAVDEVLGGLSSIWGYCTRVWARFSKDAVDRVHKNQLRTRLSAFWRKVQSVFWTELFQFERKTTTVRRDESRLRRQAVGLLMSIAAFHVEDVFDFGSILREMLKFVRDDVGDFFDRREGEFVTRMMLKRNAALLEV